MPIGSSSCNCPQLSTSQAVQDKVEVCTFSALLASASWLQPKIVADLHRFRVPASVVLSLNLVLTHSHSIVMLYICKLASSLFNHDSINAIDLSLPYIEIRVFEVPTAKKKLLSPSATVGLSRWLPLRRL